MADAGFIDLDTSAVIEKHGHGRPRGGKNKPKDVSMVASSSAVPMKRRPAAHWGVRTNPSLPLLLLAKLWMQTLLLAMLLLLLLSI
jgi:hypothetical protein